MKCDKAQDEIWERVRAGEEISEEVRQHLSACGDCARTLGESKRILGLMREADRVPPSPDCRAAVMARIPKDRPEARMAWAYASVMLVALLATGLLIGIHRQPDKQTAQEKPAEIIHQQVKRQPLPVVVRNTDEAPAQKVKPRKDSIGKRIPQVTAKNKPVNKESVTTRPDLQSDDGPVAIVSVTWSKDNDYETSYAYVEVNPETGDMTTCSVERSADSVCLNIESNSGLNESGRGT